MTRDQDVGLSIRNLMGAVAGPFTADIASNTCTVVSGPSGSGKSLLLRMIVDLDPSEGHVLLNGADRNGMPAHRWRRLVTYVAAESGWWSETVGDHLADIAAARPLFLNLGLDPRMIRAPVSRLSTGERQRAALVRAVLGRPRFLLLDEPTSALDEEAKMRVEALVRTLAEDGTGIVLVSHDTAQIERMADRHLVMTRSGLVEAPA